jgi:predicted transcriptional regulator
MESRAEPEVLLIKLFGPVSRARILTLLVSRPGQQLYQLEIMYEIGFPLQPVQRELKNLVGLGIVTKTKTLNRVYYQVDIKSPFFRPLQKICGILK